MKFSNSSEYESLMEEFIREQGIYQEFLIWLEDNYPSDLSSLGCENENP